VLVAIALAGVLQIFVAKAKVARLSAIFPSAAIHGMLAAIGLMIIVKQIPLLLGQPFEAHEFWEILQETPRKLPSMNLAVFGLGVGCAAALFLLSVFSFRLLQLMPPPVWVFLGGTALAQLLLHLDPSLLITVPEAPLANGIVLPQFGTYLDCSSLWLPMIWLVVTLILIDGTESLATIAAVDRLDPFRRKSDPDRTLLTMGVSNVCSSLLGGLTIIPGIVKSTANILGGGRTQWANFFNACFLLIFLTAGRDLINMVPKCVLASILLYVGFGLCRPRVWMKMANVGWEQFVIFTTTVVVTVSSDLLLGIIVGVVVKYALSLWTHTMVLALRQTATQASDEPSVPTARASDLFRNPVQRREYANGIDHLYCDRPMTCFNLFHLLREFDNIPAAAKAVQLHILPGVSLLDHTTCENLYHFLEEHSTDAHRPSLTIEGLDQMQPLSRHELGMRLASAKAPPFGASYSGTGVVVGYRAAHADESDPRIVSAVSSAA
jgi:MFS superfamily sulfate permease-like transporter